MEKTVEKDPVQDQQLAGLLATGKLFDSIAKDPRYRPDVLKIIKKAAPDTPIPELDIQEGINKEVEARLKPKDEEIKKLTERQDAVERRLSRESFAKQNNLADEELVEVEELAKTGGITKAETAVEFWRAKQALGTPRGTHKTPPGTAEYLDKISKTNPRNVTRLKNLATEEATRIMSSIRRAG